MTKLPLEGIRVIDLTVVWAGPFATQILADLGAEVIKLENVSVWQTYTRGIRARPTKEALAGQLPYFGGYPDGEPGSRPWNRSPTFMHLFRNKKSVTVDLRAEWGMEFLERLVSCSDVVYENNVPETLDKLGITYDWLKSVNPAIIFVRVPAYGLSGPYRDYRALGVHIEGVTSHTRSRGYMDMDPSSNTDIFASDYLSGTHGAFATMAALLHRNKTGQGQIVEIPQAESALPMLAYQIMDYNLNDRSQAPLGNRSILGHAPSGVYPCRGDDRWIAITVADDDRWVAFCNVLERPEWASESHYATVERRRARHDEIDEMISQVTRSLEVSELTTRLQKAGVAAGPVMDARDGFDDPHLRARGFFHRVHQEDIGDHDWPGFLYQLSTSPLTYRSPPVSLGEHNEYAYKELLGYSDEEYRQLQMEKKIGTEFDPEIN